MAQQTIFEILYNLRDNASKQFKAASDKVIGGAKQQEKQFVKLSRVQGEYRASLSKTLIQLRAEAKQLRDPAVQKRIREIEKLRRSNERFKTSLTGVNKQQTSLLTGIKILATGIIAQQALSFFASAAQQAENYNRQLKALSFQTQRVGVNAEKLIIKLRAVTQGQVAMEDLVQSANRAIALIGIQAIPKLEELADAALKASQVMGISVQQAIENLATGIGRQSRLILDNLGVLISITDANEKYAASLGKTVAELTEVDKKAAFLAEVLEQLDRKFGELDVTLSATDGFRASIKDLKRELGEELLPTYEAFLRNITDTIKIIKGEFPTGDLSKFITQPREPMKLFDPKFPLDLKDIGNAAERAAIQMGILSKTDFIDKAQINRVDELNLKARQLREELRLLRDPEVIGLIREIQSLDKQINSIIRPITKAKEASMPFIEATRTITNEFSRFVNKLREFEDASAVVTEFATNVRKEFFEAGVALGTFEQHLKNAEKAGRALRLAFESRTGVEFSFKNVVKSAKDALKGLEGTGADKVDIQLDITSISFQFATAIAQAFQSGNVRSSIASVMQSAVLLSQALNITTPGAAGGIMAGISFLSSLFGLGGGGRLPSPTRPVDVRLVEIVGQAATHMLGITQRRAIVGRAGVNRGVDFRNELRVMP